jgi:DNA repair protein RadC
VEVFRDYVGDADREHFLAIYLDALDRLIGLNEVAIGTINLLHVAAREIFKPAILCNANRVILLHNHPSGEPEPSSEDLALTRGIELAGMLMDIIVIDHVVVGHPGWVSLRETDQMLLTPNPEEDLTPQQIDRRMRHMLGVPGWRNRRTKSVKSGKRVRPRKGSDRS